MSVQTIRKALGQLQDEPDNEGAWSDLRGALDDVSGEEVAKFFAAARQAHLARREYGAVANLLEIASEFAKDTDAEPNVLAELARVCDEELFDDDRAQKVYERILELRPGDAAAEGAIERAQAKREKWEELVSRYVEEAKGSEETAFRASLLVSAAEVAYRYGRPKLQGEKGSKKKLAALMSEITTGLTEALEIDPKNRRAATILEHIYRDTNRWEELAAVLERMGTELPAKDEKLAAWIRLARVLSKKLKSPERASAAYEQVIDLSPGHPEATSALVDFFTSKEMWDHLVSLYDEQLTTAQRTGQVDIGMILQIAMVHWRMRGKPDAAEPYFEKLRRSEPAHPGMLDFFRQQLKEKGDHARLSQILTDAARALPEGPQRAEVASEVAHLAEEGANATKAIEQWRAILRQDPGNKGARDSLKRLYKQTAGWNALADLLRTELERIPADDTAARLSVLREIAGIYRDQIKSDSALVTVLSQIVQLAGDDIDAVRDLVRVYEALQRWRDLLSAQTRLAELETDASTKGELFRMVARRWLDQFSNVQNAVDAYEKLYEHAPTDAEALSKLKELYGKRRTYPKLYELYEREAKALPEGTERRELWIEMAKLAAERLDRGADAVKLYKKVIDEDPGAAAALDALEKQAERDKDFASVAEVLERRASHAPDDTTRLSVLQKLGAVYSERLKDHAGAMKAWKRVLELQPGHAKALRVLRDTFLATNDFDGLTGLYGDAGDWEGLAEVLSNAADRAGDAASKIDLSFRAADVYVNQLESPERAFRAYERVLSVKPDDERAAKALVPIYEKEEKWTRLPPLYEILLGHAKSNDDKLAVLRQLMVVVGENLGDKAGAFGYAKRAYELGGEGEDALADLEARAGAANQWAQFAEVLDARVNDAGAEEARALRGKIADTYAQHLSREDEAVAIRKKLVEEDDKDDAAMAALDGLLRSSDRREDLRWLFDLRVSRAETNQKVDLLIDWATLEEEVFGEPRKAIDLYRRVLETIPKHGKARRALSRLLQGVGDSEEAAQVLEADRDQQEGPERAAREVELAKMYLGSLSKPSVAFEAAKRALEAQPGMKDAIAVMEQLLQVAETRGKAAAVLESHYALTNDHARRPEVIEVMIGTARSKDDKLSLFKKLADVHEQLGAPKTAFDVMARAVVEAPSDTELWDRLSVLANKTNRTQAFVDAVALALPEGQPTGLPEAVEIDLCERAATLYEEGLGDVDRARPYLDRILTKDPSNERAFVRLKNILTALERWDDLEAAYERAIQASGVSRQVELLSEIALVAEEITSNPTKAMGYYERLLGIEPAHDHAAKALDSLYVGAERWDALAQLLEKRLERAIGDDVTALRLRLGTVYEGKLARPDTALGHLEQVLQADPSSDDARELVEKFLDIAQLRARAATVLEQVYFQSGANRDLARILEIRLETAGTDEKIELLRRIAEIHDERLNEDSKAIDAYARLVPLAPDDASSRERLMDLGRRLGAHEQVATVLEAAAKVAGSPQPKAEILGAVARIYEDLLDDATRAEAIHRQVLAVDPTDSAIALPAARALERIYAASGKTAELAEVLQAQVGLEDDEARKREIYGRLGQIREDRLEDAKGAIDAWKARADADPGDDEALAALDRLYERTGDHRALVEILRSRERGAQNPDQRKTFLVRIATTLAEKLKEVPDAIQAYRTIQDDFGADRQTLDALAKLYEAGERWDDLAETLQNALASAEGESDQLDLLARLGQVRQSRLKDVPNAIDAYRQALTIQPSHAASRERLEALLDDADAKREAAGILRPLYEADGEHEKLLRVLEIEIDKEEGIDAKLAVLAQAVVVTEQSLNDAARAFGYAARALKAAVAEAELGQWLERAERLAASTGRWPQYIDLLRSISGDVMDEALQVDVLVKIAELARSKQNDDALAKEHYKKALVVRADETRSLAALEELYGLGGEHEALLDILKRRAEAAESDDDRKAILFKEARLCDETLKDPRAAIEVYEQILDLSPDDAAFSALERLYADTSRWDDLVALLERQIGMELPAEKKARLHHSLGTVLKDRLGEYDRAFDEFGSALELVNKHEGSVQALEAIIGAAEKDPALQVHVTRASEMLEPVYLGSLDWKQLLRTLDARLRVSQDPDERRTLLRRLAKLHEEQAEDYKSALETTAKLLAEDVTDEDTWSELERLARVGGDERRLAEIYATELGKVSSDEPSTAKLAKRAAELFEQQKDTTRALEFFRRAYAFAPEESSGAFEAIDRLLRETNKPAERVSLYKEALEFRNDPKDRLTTLHTIALLQEAEIGDDDAAIESYTAALDVDDSDQHALEALSRLYARRSRWNDLAELTRKRAEQTALPEDEAKYRLELGNLLKDRLNERERAVDEYQAVVDILPPTSGAAAPAAAVKALEELISDEALKARIVEILRPIYERADAWQQLVAIGQQRLALAQDVGERVSVLKEIAKLWEDRGSDLNKAFVQIRDAFVLDPEDGETRAELDRLGEATKRWDDLATAYEGAIEKTDGVGQRELLASLAKIHDEKRDDPRRALDAYLRLFALDETDIEPLEHIDTLSTLLSDWSKLIEILVKKADLVSAGDERAATWRRIGAARSEMQGDDAGAIEAFERALELESESTEAIDKLIGLYETKDDSAKLVELYRRRVELCREGDDDLKYGLLVKAAERHEKLSERREAIALLGEALMVRPGDSGVTTRLDALYTAEQMWPELLDNLRLQAAGEGDDGKRRAVKKRIGDLLLRELSDPRSALDSYREVLEGGYDASVFEAIREIGDQHDDLRIDAADALEPVLRTSERHPDLVMVLELRLKAQSEPADRARTLRSIAETTEVKLDDPKAAEDALLRALAEEPGDASLHADIERIADRIGESGWIRYADALAERATQIFDAHITSDLYVRLGKIGEDKLKDDARAAKAFAQAAEQSGDAPDILVSLDRVTSRLGDAKALAGVLERRIAVEAEGSVQADLHHRLATLQLREFGERSRGLATLRSALDRVPDHEASRTAIEGLLEDSDLFDQAFEALEWVYRTLGRTDALAKLYGRKVDRATEVRERNRARLDLARVLDEQAKDPTGAQRVVEAALVDDPQDADALAEVERLAPVTGGWKEAGDALAKALAQAKDLPPQSCAELWVRVAQWRRDKQHDAREAEDAFAKALESEPENLEVIRALEELRRAPGRERELVETLRQRAKIETDLVTKKELLKEAKNFAEGTIADPALAEAVLRDLLGEDEGDLWALEELTNLRERAGKPDEVVTLLLRRAELEADGKEIARLRHRAAKVLSEQGDAKRAIALYEEIFDAEPSDASAPDALRSLYAREKKHSDLAKLLGRLIEISETESARSQLRIDLAKLQESMGNAEDAIQTLRRVLEEDASHKDAVTALSELYEKSGNNEELADLLSTQIREAENRGDSTTELALQVRLGEVYEERLKDAARALSTYEAVLARDSSHQGALEAVARLSEGRGSWERAATALSKLADLASGNDRVELCMRLADARGKLSDQEGVEEALKRALEVEASNTAVRERLRALYEKEKNWKGLAELLVGDANLIRDAHAGNGEGAPPIAPPKATGAPPATMPPPPAHVTQQVTLLRRAAEIHLKDRKEPSDAVPLLERAADLVPSDRELLLVLCDGYTAAGRERDATQVLEKIIASFGGRRSKDLAVFHHKLAKALAALGERDQALTNLDMAFKIDPRSIEILKDLGVLAFETNDLDRATKTFKALLLQKLEAGVGITKGEVFYYLGEISAKQGDKTRAVQMLERAIESEPGLQKAKARLGELKG